MTMKRIGILGLVTVMLLASVNVDAEGLGTDTQEVTTSGNSFWKDWFVQAGLDMSLQNPYGYNWSGVFPNGKSFGVDVALGKWFTPVIGYRGKLNWENGIGLFRNDHANWLAPFNQPGVNMDKGGYWALYADMLWNVHNLFGAYKKDRQWNASVYPRMGVVYNCGIKKGAALLGVGWLNTFRLNDKWSLYLDMAYQMCGSGFVGKEVEGTGTGSNSNGYLDINIGVQMDLGKKDDGRGLTDDGKGFWEDCFLQAALDMNLMNPYGCNFSEVFPKGKTFGIDVAAGKQFTPEFAVRARLNWENGLLKNDHLEWVPPVDNPEDNYKGGGFLVLSLDAMLNLTNVVNPQYVDNKWHTQVFLRAGLINQRKIGSASPLLGSGLEQTYRLNDRLSLFADMGYQVTTSESSAGLTGMNVAAGTNGFIDIDLGVKIDL